MEQLKFMTCTFVFNTD